MLQILERDFNFVPDFVLRIQPKCVEIQSCWKLIIYQRFILRKEQNTKKMGSKNVY